MSLLRIVRNVVQTLYGLVFTLAGRETLEVFLHEYVDRLPTIEQLPAMDGNFIRRRPVPDGGIRQTHGHDTIGKERTGLDAGGTAFDGVMKVQITRKVGVGLDYALRMQGFDLATCQPKSNRVVEYSEFHGVFSLLSSAH